MEEEIMKKKVFGILLAGIMALGLFGCGSSGNSDAGNESSTASSAASGETGGETVNSDFKVGAITRFRRILPAQTPRLT